MNKKDQDSQADTAIATNDETQPSQATTATPGSSRSGRALIVIYGVATYCFFLATFLYTIGFVSGVVVPKGINDGTASGSVNDWLVNLGLLGLFAVQHTIMARPAFKARWTRLIPEAAERSTYVLVTCLILALIFWQWRPLSGTLWQLDGAAAGVVWGFAGLGWLIVLVATFLIDHFDLFGLRQVVLHARGIPYTEPVFQEHSLYRLVRHPLLFGFLVAFWCTPLMTTSQLVFAASTTLYMVLIGIRFEERDLLTAHGEAYAEYRRRVPMLLPLGRRGA